MVSRLHLMKTSEQFHRRWLIRKAGSLKRLAMVTEPLLKPVTGDVQVAVKAIGLNFADIFACLGLYSATPEGPFTPGLEFSGIVTALGEANPEMPHDYRIGDRVIGMTRFGAYTSCINVSHHYLQPLPADWTFEQGAALPVQGLTAWYGLHELGNLAENQVVLVQSAAGGVGLQAMELIAKRKACAIAVIGSEEKAAVLAERAGVEPSRIIIRGKRFKSDLQRTLKQLSRDGLDLVFDAVYGKYFYPAYQALNPMGRYILYGAADMMSRGSRPNYLSIIPKYLMRARLDPLNMISDNRSLMGFNLIWLWQEIDLLHRILGEFLNSRPNPPYIGHEFEFKEAPAAMRFFQAGQSIGKIVLKISG